MSNYSVKFRPPHSKINIQTRIDKEKESIILKVLNHILEENQALIQNIIMIGNNKYGFKIKINHQSIVCKNMFGAIKESNPNNIKYKLILLFLFIKCFN